MKYRSKTADETTKHENNIGKIERKKERKKEIKKKKVASYIDKSTDNCCELCGIRMP